MTPKDQMLIRMYGVLTLLLLAPLLVAGRMVWIFGSEGTDLKERGKRQARSKIEIPAMRGTILDRRGRALAVNTARYDLAVDPTVEGFPEQKDVFFEKLSALTGRSASVYWRTVAERSSPEYVRLERGLKRGLKRRIAGWAVPGVILSPRFMRRYTYGRTASHLLGYVGTDGQGLAGLELAYDEQLRGEPGQRAVQRDRRGKIEALVGGKVEEPEHGQNLVLTIDLVQQTILEEELQRGVKKSGARWGTAVAMNPRTGAILGMASVPDYNPNRPRAFPKAARRNRAVTDRLEPGSTFKLVTGVTALETGLMTLDDSVKTGDGWAVFSGRTMHDTHAHGTIPFRDVIAKSSNVGTAKTASRLDPGVFYRQARDLGFGQPTWIDLPGEVQGSLKKPHRWSGTTQTSMAIGYEVAVTPLQLLTAYSALANGGLVVQPHVVAERQTVTGKTIWTPRLDSVRRAFSEETARRLLPAFERVVSSEGTAPQAQVEGLRIAGKTGTARKVVDGRYRYGRTRALFVGFFPAGDPEVALAVILDEPQTSIYGGVVAGPIFRRVAQRWAGTLPQVAATMAPVPAAPPRARRREAGPAAVKMLRIADEGAFDENTMPDLTGRDAREAVGWLVGQGVKVRIEGQGAVQAQTPRPGTPLPDRATLTLAAEY